MVRKSACNAKIPGFNPELGRYPLEEEAHTIFIAWENSIGLYSPKESIKVQRHD